MKNAGQYGSYRKTSMHFQGKGGEVGTTPARKSLGNGALGYTGGGGTIGSAPASTKGKTASEYGRASGGDAFGANRPKGTRKPPSGPAVSPMKSTGFRERG